MRRCSPSTASSSRPPLYVDCHVALPCHISHCPWSFRFCYLSSLIIPVFSICFFSPQGDINIDQPWAVQIEARKKWEAWNDQKGKSSDDAKAAYIKLVNQAATTYGVNA